MAPSPHDADLMDIGRHCAHDGCHQLDFLPFRCTRCSRVYCLEHRMCPCAASSDTVIVCPLCAKAVVCPPGADVELTFDRHTRTDCDPANYDRVHRKQRCPVAGCREKLTAVTSYTCKDCAAAVCLKHRLAADHGCAGRAAAAAQAAARRSGSGLAQSWRKMFGSGGGGAAAAQPKQQQAQQARPAPATASAPARPSAAHKAPAVVAKAKAGVAAQLAQYRAQHGQRAQPGGASAAAPAASLAGGPELCQQCGARFASVGALIAHAEAAHAGGWASGAVAAQQPRGGGLERCPHCGREFADAVQLVAHVEQQHAAAASSTCVCS